MRAILRRCLVHRDFMDREILTGIERGLSSKEFVAELRRRGLTPDDAADVVARVFAIPRGAARLYVRSHPAWSAEAPAERPRWAEADRRTMGGEPCW
jgi:hypothetical protein